MPNTRKLIKRLYSEVKSSAAIRNYISEEFLMKSAKYYVNMLNKQTMRFKNEHVL